MNEDESEKTEEKDHIDKNALAKSLILGCLSRIWNGFLHFWKWIKKNPLAFLTFMLALGTFDMARHTKRLAQSNNELVDYTRKSVQDNRDLVESNLKLLDYTRQANERAEKLFVGQNKPLIDVAPIGIVQSKRKDGTKMCTTQFSVVNYSGFVAKQIAIDVKYGDNVWISEWVKADNERKEKEEKGVETRVVLNHLYPSIPKVLISELKPGTTEKRDFEWPFVYTSAQLDLEVNVVDKKNEGFPVLVRVTWQNEDEHVFEKIHNYKLLCTTVGSGRAFTFIHEGIISQRN